MNAPLFNHCFHTKKLRLYIHIPIIYFCYYLFRLNQYDDLMEHIRDSMEKMDDGGGNFETVNTNNKRLYNTLESLVSHLDLSYAQLQVLSEPDFR